jgi:hypothetical protein
MPAGDYPGTQVPFSCWPLAQLRDPVLQGPGAGGIEAAAVVYEQLADKLADASERLRATLRIAQASHEGDAAEASKQHIQRLTVAGDVGAAQARLAAIALLDQAAYHARVRNDMQAVPPVADPPPPDGPILSAEQLHYQQQREEARVLAAEAAERYQSNTNHNLTATFQIFDPPPESGLDVSAGPSPRDPGWPSGAVGVAPAGGVNGGAAGSAGGGAGMAPGSGYSAGGAPTPAAGAAAGSSGPGFGVGPVPMAPGVSAAGGTTRTGVDLGTRGTGAPFPAGSSSALTAGAGTGGGAGQGQSGRPPTTYPAATFPSAGGAVPPGRSPGAPDRAVGAGTAGQGWTSGQPWNSANRRAADTDGSGIWGAPSHGSAGAPGGGSPGTGVRAGLDPDARGSGARPTVAGMSGEPASPGGQRGAGMGHGVPFLPSAATGGSRDHEHPRPPWLLEDDPEAVWLADLPPHTASVIRAEETSPPPSAQPPVR